MKRSQIIIFVSLVLSVLALGHFVVYESLWFIFYITSKPTIIILRIIFTALPFSFIGAILLTTRYNNFFTRTFYLVTATWIGFLLYLFMSACVLGLTSLFIGDLYLWSKFLFALAIFVGIYGYIHEKHITIKAIQIKLPGRPSFWADKKIVFVSDLHLGQIHGHDFAAKVATKIQALNPDLILIGGDLYDGVRVDNRKIIEPLKTLRANLGIYFVTGNHDGFTEKGTDEDVTALWEIGIKTLQNEIVDINGLQIAGINYRDSAYSDKFAQTLKGINIDKQKPSILLKHVPDHLDVANKKGISLVLSGHTHRAQVWPMRFLPRIVFKKFDYGLKNLGAMQVLVSSGVGTWGPPLRVGTNSEIVLITLI